MKKREVGCGPEASRSAERRACVAKSLKVMPDSNARRFAAENTASSMTRVVRIQMSICMRLRKTTGKEARWREKEGALKTPPAHAGGYVPSRVCGMRTWSQEPHSHLIAGTGSFIFTSNAPVVPAAGCHGERLDPSSPFVAVAVPSRPIRPQICCCRVPGPSRLTPSFSVSGQVTMPWTLRGFSQARTRV